MTGHLDTVRCLQVSLSQRMSRPCKVTMTGHLDTVRCLQVSLSQRMSRRLQGDNDRTSWHSEVSTGESFSENVTAPARWQWQDILTQWGVYRWVFLRECHGACKVTMTGHLDTVRCLQVSLSQRMSRRLQGDNDRTSWHSEVSTGESFSENVTALQGDNDRTSWHSEVSTGESFSENVTAPARWQWQDILTQWGVYRWIFLRECHGACKVPMTGHLDTVRCLQVSLSQRMSRRLQGDNDRTSRHSEVSTGESFSQNVTAPARCQWQDILTQWGVYRWVFLTECHGACKVTMTGHLDTVSCLQVSLSQRMSRRLQGDNDMTSWHSEVSTGESFSENVTAPARWQWQDILTQWGVYRWVFLRECHGACKVTMTGHLDTVRCLQVSLSQRMSRPCKVTMTGHLDTVRCLQVSLSQRMSRPCKVTMTGHLDTVRCLQVSLSQRMSRRLQGDNDRTSWHSEVSTGESFSENVTAPARWQWQDILTQWGVYRWVFLRECHGACKVSMTGHLDTVRCLQVSLSQRMSRRLQGDNDRTSWHSEVSTGESFSENVTALQGDNDRTSWHSEVSTGESSSENVTAPARWQWQDILTQWGVYRWIFLRECHGACKVPMTGHLDTVRCLQVSLSQRMSRRLQGDNDRTSRHSEVSTGESFSQNVTAPARCQWQDILTQWGVYRWVFLTECHGACKVPMTGHPDTVRCLQVSVSQRMSRPCKVTMTGHLDTVRCLQVSLSQRMPRRCRLSSNPSFSNFS